MTKLVPISGKDLCKILERIGFTPIRAKGSHIRFKHLDGRRTVVPVHDNEKIGIGLLSAILKQIKITREDYENLRNTV